MTEILETVNKIVWGAPALVLILGVGLFLSIRLSFVQVILFPRALRLFLRCVRRWRRRWAQET